MMEDSSKNGNDNYKPLIHCILTKHAVWTGLFIRLFLAWILPLLLDNDHNGDDDDDSNNTSKKLLSSILPSGVAYTDIDYHVFTDAAAYVQLGQSPYQRTTYRYTPFLATLLACLPYYKTTGRFIFCIADNLCGYIIIIFRKQQRRKIRNSAQPETEQQPQKESSSSGSIVFISPDLQDALWWLYNPLAINICTRGSAESLQVLLPVLLTLCLIANIKTSTTTRRTKSCTTATTPNKQTTMTTSTTAAPASHYVLYGTAIVAGIIHGVAIHSKIYPIIYTLSFLTTLVPSTDTTTNVPYGNDSLFRFVLQWIQRLLLASPALPLVFGLVALCTFIGLTWLAVHWYGPLALQEGLLYHFGRVDHRHNFSMHWYWIYLARATADATDRDGAALFLSLAGRLLFLPQLILLLYSSLVIAPQNLSLALFVQTFLFVAHNKVITGQYFTWYLVLLPLCGADMRWTRRVQVAIICLLLSLVLWWTSAYCLEMQGMAVHRQVWLASVLFFGAQVNLLSALLHSTRHHHPITSTPARSCNIKME